MTDDYDYEETDSYIERHPFTPAMREGSCLHRMPDGTLCDSKDPDTAFHVEAS